MAKGRHTDTDELEFFARCAAGFEALLADELRALRLRRVRPLKGGVAFFGTVADAYRACLWSRIATRIQLVLARLDARDGDALYAGCVRYPWETCIASGATIAVQAHGTNDALRNTQFTALKVKDAVCDRLREQRGERPDVDPRDPDIALDVSLHKSHATIFLNLSGASLHRRGYRADGIQTEAPLKETLAAGILLAAGVIMLITTLVQLFARFYSCVWERKSELALYRAVGATNKQLRAMIGGEIAIICGAGLVLGFIAGAIFYVVLLGQLQAGQAFMFIGLEPPVIAGLALIIVAVFAVLAAAAIAMPFSQLKRLDPSLAMQQADID